MLFALEANQTHEFRFLKCTEDRSVIPILQPLGDNRQREVALLLKT